MVNNTLPRQISVVHVIDLKWFFGLDLRTIFPKKICSIPGMQSNDGMQLNCKIESKVKIKQMVLCTFSKLSVITY